MNRKPLILAVLLLILALSLGYSFIMTPRQNKVPPLAKGEFRRTATAAKGAAEGTSGLLRLDTALLDMRPEPFPGVKRNLFRSTSPPPLAPPPKVVTEATPQPVIPPPTVVAPPIVQPVETPARALARFTFLGYLQRGEARSIFLSSAGEIFVVHPGDRFGRRREFQVMTLSATQMVIRQGDDPRDIVVQLVEQAPLTSATTSAVGRKGGSESSVPPRRTAGTGPETSAFPPPPDTGADEEPPENDPTQTEGFTHGNNQ